MTSMEEVQKIFDEADEDKSGGLSLEEFKKVIKKMNEEITKQRNKLPEEMACENMVGYNLNIGHWV